MNTLPVAMAGPGPQSVDARTHTWQSGDSSDLISYGTPDQGVSVYPGRCRCYVVPLLAAVSVAEDLRGSGGFLEIDGTPR